MFYTAMQSNMWDARVARNDGGVKQKQVFSRSLFNTFFPRVNKSLVNLESLVSFKDSLTHQKTTLAVVSSWLRT